MSWRFRKTIHLTPGLRLNLSKSGLSLSMGRPGFTINTGPRGTYLTLGLPGTGLSYRTRLDAAAPRSVPPATTVSHLASQTPVAQTYSFSNTPLLVALLAFGVLAIGLMLINISSSPARRSTSAYSASPRVTQPTPTRATVRAIAASLPTASPTPPPTPTHRAAQSGHVTTTANLRSGPSTDSTVVGQAAPGERVEVISCNASCDWYQLASGVWIFAALVALDTPDATAPADPQTAPVSQEAGVDLPWGVVTAPLLNVRAGPGTDHAILTTLAAHSCVDLLRLEDNWYEVQLVSAQTGWCSAAYLEPVAACPESTVAAAVATDTASAEPAAAAPAGSPVAEASATPIVPGYVGQPFVPNATLARSSYLHECFGQGDAGLRWADAGTPIQILGTGLFVPPADQVDELGAGPFLKIRIWDGQYAWLPAGAVDTDVTAWPQVPGECAAYDTIDWATVIRPTPVPQWMPDPVPTAAQSQRSCCKICTTGKACGDSCIARNKTCHKGAGCACDG